MTISPANRKIRARIEQLCGSLRSAYNFAQQNRNDQRSRDRWVVEVMRLERLIQGAEQSLEVFLAAQRHSRALAAAALAPFVSTPVAVAELAPAI